MTTDHAQSSRLGQRTPVESPGVQVCTLETLPEVGYRGQLVYLAEKKCLGVYDGDAWLLAGTGAGTIFVQPTEPVADEKGNLWLNTTDYQLYVWDGTTWTPNTNTAAAGNNKLALGLAIAVKSVLGEITDDEIVVRYQGATPLSAVNDLWVNTAQNRVFKYTATGFIEVTGEDADAIRKAGYPRAIAADLETHLYFTEPTGLGPEDIGDIWYSDAIMVWTGAAWADLQILTDEIADEAITKDKVGFVARDINGVATFYQDDEPSPDEAIEGDFWIDTDDGNRMYRFNGTVWEDAQATAIDESVLAIIEANQDINNLNQVVLPALEQTITEAQQDLAVLNDSVLPELNEKLVEANQDLTDLNNKFPIQTPDIGDGAITTGKITVNTLNGDRILANTINALKIVANSITTNQIQANAVNGDRITANTLNADKIIANSITGDRIQANSVSGDVLIGNTINGNKIIANTINTAQLNALAINGMTITGATIQTATSGQRVMLASDGLSGYNSSGTKLTSISSSTGQLTATGANISGNVTIGDPNGDNAVLGTFTNSSNGAVFGKMSFRNGSSEKSALQYSGRSLNLSITDGDGDLFLNAGTTGTSKIRLQNAFDLDGYTGNIVMPNIITVTASANAYISTGKQLVVCTSRRDAKLSIESMDLETVKKFMTLDVRTWIDRASAEEWAEVEAGRVEWAHQRYKDIPLTRIPGLVAEEVEAAGLKTFVQYDMHGRIAGLSYDRVGVAWIPLVRDLYAQNVALTKRIEALEKKTVSLKL